MWKEFDFITLAPVRQFKQFIWFERTEPPASWPAAQFDIFRSEDKDVTSEAKIAQLAEVYLAKAREVTNDVAMGAVRDYFDRMNANMRALEQARAAAEPSHLEALLAFAARAYRRPLSKTESDDLLAFYRSLRDQDLGHEDAVRDTVVSVLMSPHFCYRVDPLPDARRRRDVRPLSDYELASRLSYFLWSSMPDDELLTHAAAGDLHKPEVLAAQARRMLRDDRVRRLATEFAGNWLDFRRFEEHNGVDRERFPSFTTSCAKRCSRSRSASSSTSSSATARCSISSTATTRSSTRCWPGTTACRSRPDGPTMGPRRRRAAVRARRAAADGGLPDQERARAAHQPGQARLLGRPPAARRVHPGAAAERARSCRPTRPSSAT